MSIEIIYYYPEGHAAHKARGHPERPERVETLRQALENSGYWRRGELSAGVSLSEAVLHAIHSPAYLERLKEACRRGQYLDADTYTTPASWELALHSAGGAAAVAEMVWQGAARSGFALCRPPGHHATAGQGMGFCLLNNVALACEQLIQNQGACRLAVVDLDLHHGNGTQDIFWDRGDVFYISTHQAPLYPGSGAVREIGAGAGRWCTANFPLPPGSGDQAFLALTNEALVPMLSRYRPEMVLVSFGFDPHWKDPLGHLKLSAAGYGCVIAELAAWCVANCQGRLALFLEGGYDLDAAAACAPAVVAALLGEEWQDTIGPAPRSEGYSWRVMLDEVKRFWELVE